MWNDGRTLIIKDPEVEDYFVNLEPEPSFRHYRKKYGGDFARWYETGRVVVMDNVPITPDYEMLWKVIFPYDNRKLKKIKSAEFLKPIKGKNKESHPLVRIFGKDMELAKAFQAEIARIDDILMKAAVELFPRYGFIKDKITWRFSVTHTEGLHFDVYHGYEGEHILRIFFNVDSFPRVWYMGERAETALSTRLDDSWGNDSNLWNKRLTNEYGGDWRGVKPSASPQHVVMFAPGSMWIAHSQYVSHGPLFGRRMVAMSINVDPKTMQTPDLCFSNLPSRMRRR